MPHFRIRTSALIILRSESVDVSRDLAQLDRVARSFKEIDDGDLRNDVIEEGAPCDVPELLAELLEILGSITREQLASEHFVAIAYATYAQVLARQGNINHAKAESNSATV